MVKLKIHLSKEADRSYEIIIGRGLLQKIPKLLKKKKLGNKYAVIADSTVAKLYGKKLIQNLKKIRIKAHLLTFPAGERSKTLKTVEMLMQKMLSQHIDRTDAVIALGGGVTGDMAAFISSIFMRGIPYIHIPTTLLAMVDSSIGGKTGVDLTDGKNLAGTFYQPKSVYIDTSILKTLPKKEFFNGFAEIIKYGIIKDYSLFYFLEKNIKRM